MISPIGIEASLRAIEELSAGDAAQRAALARQLEQLEYEARRAFEQYDTVDARNRLAAAELERRWNDTLEEREAVKRTAVPPRWATPGVVIRGGSTNPSDG